eukprot:CAMPEP_0196757642 /NCGR_PEP_ID=MMETSP1091-20130531/103771_1 /TAXON_ID=302021 /ORGANISM="Rhodomonas sp., Strain CCMP768" /LENGTH=108 /DNA_ID=CAMNT_0042106429 /DNA_START=793 /DNA_END=1120 /DNA_ORIENTATION=-
MAPSEPFADQGHDLISRCSSPKNSSYRFAVVLQTHFPPEQEPTFAPQCPLDFLMSQTIPALYGPPPDSLMAMSCLEGVTERKGCKPELFVSGSATDKPFATSSCPSRS